MKKYLILLMLIFLAPLLFIKTNALTPVESLNYTWEPYNITGEKWAMRIDFETDLFTEYIQVQIPGVSDNAWSVTGTYSTIAFEYSDSSIIYINLEDMINPSISDLDPLYYFPTGYDITTDNVTFNVNVRNSAMNRYTDSGIAYHLGILETLEDVDEDAYITDVSIRVMIDTNYSGGTATYYNAYLENTYNYIVSSGAILEFYNGFTLLRRVTIARDIIKPSEDYPDDPTPSAGYDFYTWHILDNLTGEPILMADYDYGGDSIYIRDNWIDGTDIERGIDIVVLRALYVSEDSLEYDTPVIIDGAPDGFNALLGAFGFNNSAGKIIVFIILIAVVTIVIASFGGTTLIYMIMYSALTILFIALGWLPLFVAIIAVMALLLLLFIGQRGEVIS